MTEHVLVATDGSDTSNRAVEMASRIAKGFDARMTVLHVLLHGSRAEEASRLAEAEHLVEHVSTTAVPDIVNLPGSMAELLRSAQSAGVTARIIAALGDRIAEVAANTARSQGVRDVQVRVVPGDYAEMILETASDVRADMIVMGSRGLGNLRGLLMGSVSNKVSHHAKVSVLTVR